MVNIENIQDLGGAKMSTKKDMSPKTPIESEELEQFKKLANEIAVCYLLAPRAINEVISKFKGKMGRDNSLYLGTNLPGQGGLKYSTINFGRLMKLYQDGEFQDILYKSLIVHIYSIWEREYRKKIADELGKGEIESDLMGDLRHMRHAILHNSQNDLKKMKYEPWRNQLQQEVRITSDIIGSLQEKLNQFSVGDLSFNTSAK